MKAWERLSTHMEKRPIELRKMREQGVKIVGYTPGGFMSEELVCAYGALPIPVGLIRGGDPEPVTLSGAYIPRFIDTFCRSQIGYRESGDEPLYGIIDLLVAPITDTNIRAIADMWDFYTDVEVFRYGVPHAKTDRGYKYYLEGLHLLKEKLEGFTSTESKDEKLREEIISSNRIRELLQEISLMRKSERPPITGREFARLNHASFYADKTVFVGVLESLSEELKEKEAPSIKVPRILLTGSTLAMGDYKIYDLLEAAGAIVVIEEFCEGIRHYWETVKIDGDLMEALADRYFRRRVPCAFFRPAREMIDFILKLAADFNVDGIIWYQLMYRDSYDIESFYFDKICKEKGIPLLKLQSDYDMAEKSSLRTKVETFVETIKGR